MTNSVLTQNNLGGVGPDSGPEEYRISEVGNLNGRILDVVVTEANGLTYRPNLRVRNNNGLNCANLDVGANGVGHDICREGGAMAQINLGSGLRGKRLGEEVTLNYNFVYQDNGAPAVLPGFYISFFDIDQNRNALREKLYMKGFKEALMEPDAEIIVKSESGWTSYTSQKVGKGCDNPTDPKELGVVCGVDQRKRSVTFLFEEASSFQLRFETVCSKGCQEKGQSDGRNFLFAFTGSLSDLCT